MSHSCYAICCACEADGITPEDEDDGFRWLMRQNGFLSKDHLRRHLRTIGVLPPPKCPSRWRTDESVDHPKPMGQPRLMFCVHCKCFHLDEPVAKVDPRCLKCQGLICSGCLTEATTAPVGFSHPCAHVNTGAFHLRERGPEERFTCFSCTHV